MGKYGYNKTRTDDSAQKWISESAGTGRQARLRGVCHWRTGSSPVSRTISHLRN